MNNLLDRHSKYLRYVLLLSLITFVILFIASAAHGAWYTDWNYRKKITIHSSRVSGGTHSNFPVLIKLTSDANLAADAQSNGDDILFTAADGETKIPHEIESFNGSTGALVAWVRVDSISSSFNPDIYIYMYYGNGSASNQENAPGVWDANFKGVWHLKEEATGIVTDDLYIDSTSNPNDGDDRVSATGQDGKIASGQQFDGSNDYVGMGNVLDYGKDDPVTYSAWIKTSGAWIQIAGKADDSSWQGVWFYLEESGEMSFQLYDAAANGKYKISTDTFNDNQWHHVVATYDGSNSVNGITLYGDGSELTIGPSANQTLGTVTNSNSFNIGAVNDGAADPFDGYIDEVRLSNTVRDADWIRTEYNNQVWPNTADTPSPTPSPDPGGGFITVGSYESGGGGNVLPVVEAGAPQTIGLPDTDVVINDASASDPDSGPSSLITTWSQVSGPATVTFAPDVNALNPTASGLTLEGDYVLKLSAYDGADTSEDTVTITVTSLDLGSYSCNMKITFQGSQVQGGPHNDFPALISLTDESLKTSGCGFVTSDDGYDILFTDSTQSSQLDHEIEKYDKDTGELIAWVKVDLNASPTNTEIYMYYGNSGAGDQQNATGVWDSNYVGVWHLHDDVADSTSYNNDGIGHNIDNDGGKIADGEDFDGTGDWIEVPHSSSLNLTGDVTMEFWMNYDTKETWDYFVGKGDDYSSDVNYGVQFWDWSNGWGSDYTNSSNTWCGGDANTSVSAGSWYHIVTTYNSSTNVVNFYVNGNPDGTDSGCDADTSSVALGIGADGLGNREFDGDMDEVRISNTLRSPEWIQTSYNNQNDPSSFYNKEIQCPSTTPPIAEFTCSIPITIDSSKVAGTGSFTDFPVLISFTDTALKTVANCGYVQNSNGYDIIFSDSAQTIQLDHEVEKYDPASGELIAWVRIPTLSATTDTVINVHFGHSSVCGPIGNPTGVWSSKYRGVWHLNETVTDESTGGTHYDSTSNNNHGAQNENDEEPGKIANGQEFDGNDDYVSISDSGSLDFGTGKITVEAWVKSTQAQVWDEYPRILDKIVDSPKTGYALVLYLSTDSPNPIFDIQSGGTGAGAEATVNIRDGSWHHVVGTKNDTKVKIFIDGSLSATENHSLGTSSNAADLLLGKSFAYNSDHFEGTLDEIRVSNAARGANWIETTYNNQNDPSSFYSVGASSCSLGGFSCNRKITIDSAKVEGSSDFTNFPFLIKIQDDCNLKTAANGGGVENSSGWDIIFIDSDGVTQLDHEIEEYNGTTGDLTAWVRVPTLPYNSDKDIYMYYGKSGLTCDPSNPTGVWDSSYEAVYHLNGDVNDSTSNDRDGYNDNTSAYASVIEDGRNLSPVDDFDIGTWGVSGQGLTLQAWARFDDFDQNDPRVFSKASSTSEQDHVFMLGLGGNLEQHLRMRVKTGTDDLTGTTTTADTDDPLSTGTWYLIAGTYDGSNMRLLSDGVQVHSAAKTGNIRVNSWEITVGNSPGNSSSTAYSMDGKLDELRISSVARSADWLKTEYNNQDDPDSFYTMSQDTCGGTFGFSYQYCKKISVDHTQVNSDLTDFPLLVNITGDDDLKTVANGGRVEHSQGWDIVFRTSGCGNLDHEIEKYDGSTGDLVAWVRVPNLSSSTDTEIYMYYGASVICSPENAAGVWDANYAAVWHLKEDPGGTAPQSHDSTSNDNDGTSNGSMTTADLVSGKIGNGIDFDGSNDWIESPNSSSLDITGNEITLSAWVKMTAGQSDDAGIINKSYSNNYNYMLNVQSTEEGNFRVKTPSGTTYLDGSTTLNVGQWYFLYGIYDGANAKVYLNGSEDGTDARTGTIESSGEAPVVLGRRRVYPTVDDRFFTGVIDEVHISNVARSTDWMITEFRNQNDPGNFYTVGSCFEQTMTQTNAWEEEFQ